MVATDQGSGQFLGALRNLAHGFLAWIGEEKREPEHPDGADNIGHHASPSPPPSGPPTLDVAPSQPSSIPAGGFRNPDLTETGNPRVPPRFPQDNRGDNRGGSGWRSPGFSRDADAGTPEGARKAAAARAAGSANVTPESGGWTAVGGNNQQGQPWQWAKKIATHANGSIHGGNIKHAGEPRQFHASRSFTYPGRTGGGVKLGPFNSFGEAHNAIHEAVNKLPSAPHSGNSNDMRSGWRSPAFGRDFATDPPVSEAQRKAMHAAAHGQSNIGIPQHVGKEFAEADPGGHLPERKGNDAGQSEGGPSSQAQRGAMWAAAGGQSNIGIPKSVGEEFAQKDPGGKLPETTDAQRFKLYDSKTGMSYNIDKPLDKIFGGGDEMTEDDEPMVGATPEQQYHGQQYKLKQRLYEKLRGQVVPPAFAEVHTRNLNGLQREMLDHAQKGGFSHQQQQPQQGAAPGGGVTPGAPGPADAIGGGGGGGISTDPIQAQALRAPTAAPQALRAPAPTPRSGSRDWGSPGFPRAPSSPAGGHMAVPRFPQPAGHQGDCR